MPHDYPLAAPIFQIPAPSTLTLGGSRWGTNWRQHPSGYSSPLGFCTNHIKFGRFTATSPWLLLSSRLLHQTRQIWKVQFGGKEGQFN